MSVIAIIPARSGSKRLPGKNIRPLAGKPLLVWTIAAAEQAGLSEIVVSTDSQEIADIAMRAGARAVMRPVHLSTDEAETLPVVRHAVMESAAKTIVLLQPTSPLRSSADILEALAIHKQTGRPVVSVSDAPKWLFWRSADGSIVSIEVPPKMSPVCPNGAVYVCATEALASDKAWWTDPVGYIMPADRSVDIDTVVDFDRAEKILTAGLGR